MTDTFAVCVKKGDTIFSQGEQGDCAYIIENGQVDLYAIVNGESVLLTQFSEGEVFGEMALIDNELRSGTAIAASNVTLVTISQEYIERSLNKSNDIIYSLLQVVLFRYREMRHRFEEVAKEQAIDLSKVKLKHTTKKMAVNTASTAYRIQEESRLYDAFNQSNLELYYQPIINIQNNEIAGCESLIRWNDPERGLILPHEFIGLAEDTGLILPIGLWIIEEACNALNRMSQFSNEIYMSINLSPKQFESKSIVSDIHQIFKKSKVKPDKLYFEITETTLMSDPIIVSDILNRIKSTNANISLDDFGTGYSSFSYLHRFPIDVLKIDRSFVATMLVNQKSKEIVRTICSLANSLDMKIVAEGIEQPEEQKILNDFESTYGQGFYFGKPMPEKKFTELLLQE